MKLARSLLFVTLLICLLGVERATAQCVDRFSRKDAVEIPVILRFRNSHYHADWAYKLLDPKLKMPNLADEIPSKKESITDKGLEAVFCVDADYVRSNSNFEMLLGPRRYSIIPRPVALADTDFVANGRKLRLGKMSLIQFLSLEDPSWLLLESVRILKVLQRNTWILEATIANKSDHPVALQQLIIRASHPRGDGVSCDAPDPPQEVTISWNKIISGSDKGAWTKLGDSNVQVKVSYNSRGECSNFFFYADIPIQHNVAAEQVIRVEIKINEMPPTVAGIRAPQSLVQWERFNVSFYPEVYPAWVEVKR